MLGCSWPAVGLGRAGRRRPHQAGRPASPSRPSTHAAGRSLVMPRPAMPAGPPETHRSRRDRPATRRPTSRRPDRQGRPGTVRRQVPAARPRRRHRPTIRAPASRTRRARAGSRPCRRASRPKPGDATAQCRGQHRTRPRPYYPTGAAEPGALFRPAGHRGRAAKSGCGRSGGTADVGRPAPVPARRADRRAVPAATVRSDGRAQRAGLRRPPPAVLRGEELGAVRLGPGHRPAGRLDAVLLQGHAAVAAQLRVVPCRAVRHERRQVPAGRSVPYLLYPPEFTAPACWPKSGQWACSSMRYLEVHHRDTESTEKK